MITDEKFLEKTKELRERLKKQNSVMYSNIVKNKVYENKNKEEN